MSLTAGRARLLSAYRDLHMRLDRTRQDWNDPVRARLEAEFIEPLETEVRAAVAAIEQMEAFMRQAQAACS